VIAVDTLMAVAEDARLQCGATDVWATMDARMDEIHAAHYLHDGQGWQTLVAPALYAPHTLEDQWRVRPPRAIAGSALRAFVGRLATGDARLVPDARPGARALLACARAAWPAQSQRDAASAQPLYLRLRVALTTTERAARAAPAA
jgi:tRNA threonylcarbamoyladenosine biosynthesis protein TsaB